MSVEGGTISAGKGGSTPGGVAVGVGSPVSLGENNMTTSRSFNLEGEIRFDSMPLSVSDIMAEAQSIISQVQSNPLSEQAAVAEVNYHLGLSQVAVVKELTPQQALEKAFMMLVLAHSFFPTPLEIAMMPNVSQAVIEKVIFEKAARSDTRVNISSQPQAKLAYIQSQPLPAAFEVPETEEEEEEVQERVTIKPLQHMEKEVERVKRKYLKDKPVLDQRIYEIKQAFRMAEIAAKISGFGERIAGFLVAKFMREPHPGNISHIVQPDGPDGSLEEIEKEINSGEFSSEKEVVEVVLNHNPVMEGEEGELVTDQEISEVTRYIMKPKAVEEIIKRRIVKKKAQILTRQESVPSFAAEEAKYEPETTIEDFQGLPELFGIKKAA